jgi:hypothetical protein
MLRNVKLANAILKQEFGLSEDQCIPAGDVVSELREDDLVEFVSLLKLLLTSKACKHAMMLEARDAAVAAQRDQQKRRWRKVKLAVAVSSWTKTAPDPRHSFNDALRLLDPDLHGPTRRSPILASEVLRWCRESTAAYPELQNAAWRLASRVSSTWINGVGFCALVHAHRPALIDWAAVRLPASGERLSKEDSRNNLELAAKAGRGRLEIPDSRNLPASDLLASRFDPQQKQNVLRYLSLLKKLLTSHASRRAAQLEAEEEGAPQPRASATDHQSAIPVANGDDTFLRVGP